MSALAATDPEKPTSQSLAKSEADLRVEATAIEKLRKQIKGGGASISKEMVAEFAKRQKAFLECKIDLVKQKRVPSAKNEEPTKSAKAGNAVTPVEVAGEPVIGDTLAKNTDSKSANPESGESTRKSDEPKPERSLTKKSDGVSAAVWILVAAAIAVAVWHFLGK